MPGRGFEDGGNLRYAATLEETASIARKLVSSSTVDSEASRKAKELGVGLVSPRIRSERVHLVLNRFRKIPGFSEADAEAASGLKLMWKIPNHYFAVSAAIDRGVPVMQQGNTEIARSFSGLAAKLTENDVEVKRRTWSLFKTVS